jgi:hypothetical protein
MPSLRKLRLLAFALAAQLLLVAAAAPAARAAVIGSEAALAVSPAGDAHRAAVDAFLARADVQEQLEALGVDPADAQQRVALLTDQEASELSARIAELPAGGIGWLGVVGIIALVFVTLIVLDYLGVTDIFPWVVSRR